MKFSVLLSCLLCLNYYSFAQNVRVGLEIAQNINPINDSEISNNYKLGIHSGLSAEFQIKNNLHFTTGLKISQKSQYNKIVETSSLLDNLDLFLSFLGPNTINIDSITEAIGVNTDIIQTKETYVNTNHFQIPLMASYNIENFQIHLGGYAGVLLSANNKTQRTQDIPVLEVIDISQFDSTGIASFFLPKSGEVINEESSSTDDLNKFDFGGIVGLSYVAKKMNFGLYYTHGFVDYQKGPIVDQLNAYKSLRFSLSYLISVRKEEGKIILQ